MQYVGHSKPKLLIADEGKKIRNINDLYIPAEYDEEGNLIKEEHLPYYSTIIFLAEQIDSLEKCKELYVEEEE